MSVKKFTLRKQRSKQSVSGRHVSSRTFEGEVEAAEPVSGKRVGPTLENDGRWSVDLHHLGHDRFEDHLISLVVDAVAKWKVDSIVLALLSTHVLRVHMT